MPQKSTVPQTIYPYVFHGLDLEINSTGTQAIGDCPWCGKEGKFSVEVATGKWRCFSCNEGDRDSVDTSTHGGNSYTFLRLLWEYSIKQQHVYIEGQLRSLANERRLRYETLQAWGVTPSLLRSNDFLLPGFGIKGSVNQLYRYSLISKNGERKRVLMATPKHGVKEGAGNEEIYHTLYGLKSSLYDPAKDTVYLCEGPWDAMALWEVLGGVKWTDKEDGKLAKTSNRDASLLADANVLAVPGCNTFKPGWLEVFAGKKVILLYDNDHPRIVNGRDVGRGGYNGMVKAARLLTGARKPPLEISYLHWGNEGYDPDLPSGYDVRDLLTEDRSGRTVEKSAELLERIQPVPPEWVKGVRRGVKLDSCGAFGVKSAACISWKSLTNEWRRALSWRQTLDDCLSVMLSVCLSTDQVGDQLFLQLIGEAGSAKTKLCEALLTSSHCHPLEKMKGFVSGWKRGKGDDDEDYSLLARINHKTLITAEGDLLMSSPNFAEIMSEQRRIFDGSTSSSYKNRKEDRTYTGLRTPWIIAGTPALLNRADVHLGDRFLRVYISKPTPEERAEILLRSAYAADRNTMYISSGEAEKTQSPEMVAAYKATGGYVDYLRENVTGLVSAVDNPDWAIRECITLATFTALLRSRPDPNPNSEMVCSEEPTRLTQQFVRLAKNLTVVLGKKVVDKDVMRRVRKVALDTAKGLTLDLCRLIYWAGDKGVQNFTFTAETGHSYEKRLRAILVFLAKIGVTETFNSQLSQGVKGTQRWRLTKFLRLLYRDVVMASKRVVTNGDGA